MMKGRRWASLLTLLVAMALVAAACGDGDDTEAPDDFRSADALPHRQGGPIVVPEHTIMVLLARA